MQRSDIWMRDPAVAMFSTWWFLRPHPVLRDVFDDLDSPGRLVATDALGQVTTDEREAGTNLLLGVTNP